MVKNFDNEMNILEDRGFVVLRNVLDHETCDELVDLYTASDLYRSVIKMERYRFGKGEYKYFAYPLPEKIESMRRSFYRPLSKVANAWMEKLNIQTRFPAEHQGLIEQCKSYQQFRPTPLILRYEQGGYNTLHQDLYGEIYFPFQVVFALTQYGVDHEGGELVLVEQVPRAQSIARVIRLNKGDALIFTTNFRPTKSIRGYYRATMKHGVSELTGGTRYALGLIFHDAL